MTDDISDSPFRTGGGLDALKDIDRAKLEQMEGRVLGDYRVTGLIAEGGMGRVYRAERVDGSFEREVAIKISAISNVSDKMHERFQLEQSLLASLNHPNIAQLFDARVTEEGWPYFVMEHVDGGPVDEYCETADLSLNDRVRLFIDIVDAVAYAHSRLVVHRDLKPSNVLVTSDGRAKLLDFGIAKLLEGEDAELSRVVPLTPRYASPEQLLGQPVTIASDVFQLGHLLYQILLGRPLMRDDTLAEAIARATDERSMPVDAEARRGLPHELVLIIEQCLRPLADDRYRDANVLRDDLQAFLDGYPVRAAGQSAGYRLRKLLRRNLATTITAGLAILAIVSGISWYTWQLGVARDEAERQAVTARFEANKAEQVAEFLVGLFGAEDPSKARGEEITVGAVLESGIEKIRSDLEGQEALQADLLMTLGSVYAELDEFDKARPLLEEAIQLHRSAAGDDATGLAMALLEYARLTEKRSDLNAMASAFEEALAVARTTNTKKGREIEAATLNTYGIVLSRLNRFEESEAVYQETIALHEEIYGADHVDTSVPQANYAQMLMKLGRDDEALPLLEKAYAIAVEEFGPYHPWIAPRAINLANAWKRAGRLEEAEELLRVALDQDQHIYGNEHQYVASSLQNLGIFVFENRDELDGLRLLEEGLAIEENALGDDHIYTNQTRTVLANYYIDVERYEESEALLDRAKPNLLAAIEGDHRYLIALYRYLGKLYLRTARIEQAVQSLEMAVAMVDRLLGEDMADDSRPLLASAYTEAGAHLKAYESYLQVVNIAEQAVQVQDHHYEVLEELRKAAFAD